MALASGARIGPYEIVGSLGAGGMGEVYRARDTRLNREVALKVLPERFAADPDRRARFTREAQTLASLNHASIGGVHGLEEEGRVLVLELVEGPTLAERIAAGPLPFDTTLAIALQIADALDAAHARGIVHRDLKPANVKIRPDGTVKVLDFGLAKLVTPDSGDTGRDAGAALTNSPTAFGGTTEPGIVLGTAAYMAPEQARGDAVDKRADTWAFGVMVFEMLTGRPLFARASLADTIAAVLHDEPDLTRVSASARRLVGSCLQKDPKRRLRDIGDARLLIDDVAALPHAPVSKSRLGWMVAGACALLAAASLWAPWRTAPPAPERIRFQITPRVAVAASGASAISPDGRRLAFLGSGADGVLRVWIRDLDALVDRPLPGTEISGPAPPPFWSPDSRFIGFDAGAKLKKVDVSGGLAQTICDLPNPAIGGSWNRDGVILFGNLDGGIMRVSDDGGVASPLTAIHAGEAMHLTPVFLPDGRHFLYLRAWPTAPDRTGIFVGSIDRSPGEQENRRILATPTSVAYVPARHGAGSLLFLRDGNLMVHAFNEERLETTGTPELIAARVHSYLDTAAMSTSSNGILVYRSADELQLTWLDRHGRVVSRLEERGPYQSLALSPDGTRALVSRVSGQVASVGELWLFDFTRQASTRVTPSDASDAAWSPDGGRVVFDADNGIHQKVLGTPEQKDVLTRDIANMPGRKVPTSWSPDGTLLLFTMLGAGVPDIWTLSLGAEPKATPFLRSAAAESQGQFSPGPRRPLWVAYTSTDSGRSDVFIRTFPDGGNVQVVSRSGGHSPRWRADGKELFYVSNDGALMAAAVGGSPLLVGTPMPLFRVPRGFATRDSTGQRGAAPWDVTQDGQRFLFAAPDDVSGLAQFTVVLDWRPGSKP